MKALFSYPFSPFDSTLGYLNYKKSECDGNLCIDIKLPGIQKDDITLIYKEEYNSIRVEVKDYYDQNVLLHPRTIDPASITATLELGILKIKAPILNRDRKIDIT